MTIIILHTNGTIYFFKYIKKRMWKVFTWKYQIGGTSKWEAFFWIWLSFSLSLSISLETYPLFHVSGYKWYSGAFLPYKRIVYSYQQSINRRSCKLSVKTVHWKWKRNTHYEREKNELYKSDDKSTTSTIAQTKHECKYCR